MKSAIKSLGICLLVSVVPFEAAAQSSTVTIDKNLIYRQGKTPDRVDNHHYTSFFTADKDVYNLKNIPLSGSSPEIVDFKVNPAGYSYAVLSGKGKKYRLTVYDSNTPKLVIAKRDKLVASSAITYSPDSRSLYLAENSRIEKLSSKTLESEKSFGISGKPERILADPNGLYIVCVYPDAVEVYNEQEGILRSKLDTHGHIADVSFSKTGDLLGVLSADGVLETFNTRDFKHEKRYTDLGSSHSLSFHPDGKYAAVATDGNRIQFVNLIDDFDRPYITDPLGPLNYTRFVTNSNGELFITFNGDKSIIYKRVSGFAPHYSKMMRDQVNDRMREWSKMRPMETEEEYRERMNPENVERQRKLFANEIATSLAGDLISHGTVALGKYNPQTGLLSVNIGSLPTIYLQVPQDDMAGFGDGTNLKFSNAVYGITPGDTFELIYVDVFNPTNGKKYSFDNLDRQDLGFLATDDSFMSLDLIMKSNREDVILKDIKDRIVEEARALDLISDHTHINVDTRIEPAFDANGKSINNYRVSFDYTVDPDYSEKEDYPSGKYMLDSSNAASSMMRIVKQAFDNEFADYLGSGKKIIVEITGSADGAPINKGIPYDGSLGDFDNEPVKVNGELTSLSVSSASGIRNNEQLAFMRAQGLRQDMQKQLYQLEQMETDYRYNVEISNDRGGKYRRISLSLTFVDAM